MSNSTAAAAQEIEEPTMSQEQINTLRMILERLEERLDAECEARKEDRRRAEEARKEDQRGAKERAEKLDSKLEKMRAAQTKILIALTSIATAAGVGGGVVGSFLGG